MVQTIQTVPFSLRERLNAEFIRFGHWLPDVAPLGNPGCLVARNCLPFADSYRPFRRATFHSPPLPANASAVDFIWAQDSQGRYTNVVAANDGKLYTRTASNDQEAWTDVSLQDSNGDFEAWSGTDLHLAKYGDYVLAIGPTQPLSFHDLRVGGRFAVLNSSVAGATGVSPTAPTAKTAGVVRDWFVLGNLGVGGQFTSARPTFVQWCGRNNVVKWDPTVVADLTDYNELPSWLGPVQSIVPGRYGTIICEHGIVRMQLADISTTFSFDVVERDIGTPCPKSVCWLGELVMFYTNTGFMSFDGQRITPIGNNRIDNWFHNEASNSHLSEMQAAVDYDLGIAIWAFRSSGGLDQRGFDRLLFYNVVSQGWSYAIPSRPIETLSHFTSGTANLDSSEFAERYPVVDASQRSAIISKLALINAQRRAQGQALLKALPDDDPLKPPATQRGIDTENAPAFSAVEHSFPELKISAFVDNRMCTFDSGAIEPAKFVTGQISAGVNKILCSSVRPVIHGLRNAQVRVSVECCNDPSGIVETEQSDLLEDDLTVGFKAISFYQAYGIEILPKPNRDDATYSNAHGVIPRIGVKGRKP